MAYPRVSVVLAVHNAGGRLQETVGSVLAQSWGDFELILIDDGSSDGCLDFVPNLSDPRIRMLSGPRLGAAAAVNTGLAAATGEWIAFLDHDDLWLPGKLHAHLQCIAQHPETDLTFDWSRSIDEHGNDLGLPTQPWRGTISFAQLLEDFVIGNTAAITVRRAAVLRAGMMNPGLRRVYDVDLCLRVAALRPGNCRSVPEYLTLYRRYPGQLSGDWRELQKEWERLLALIPAYAPGPAARHLAVGDSNMRRYFAWIACEAGEGMNALRLSLSAFQRDPMRALPDRRNWMMLAAACGRLALPRSLYQWAIEMGKKGLR